MVWLLWPVCKTKNAATTTSTSTATARRTTIFIGSDIPFRVMILYLVGPLYKVYISLVESSCMKIMEGKNLHDGQVLRLEPNAGRVYIHRFPQPLRWLLGPVGQMYDNL